MLQDQLMWVYIFKPIDNGWYSQNYIFSFDNILFSREYYEHNICNYRNLREKSLQM